MKDLTEKDIIIQMQNNDFTNFDIIYKKYYKKVFFIVLKMLKDEKLSEDITQEVFLDACTGIHKLKNIDIFNSWLIKIAINQTNLAIKKKIHFRNKNCIISNKSLINNDFFLVNFEKNIIKNEISNLINLLPETKKRIIILFYFNELSLNEISKIENIPLGTVKSRLHIAKKMLKNIILSKNIDKSEILSY